jgi:hypothetical protein
VVDNWQAWRDQGLTQHANWWPTVYQSACRTWNVTPDPRVLEYSTSYEAVRADLREVSGSA